MIGLFRRQRVTGHLSLWTSCCVEFNALQPIVSLLFEHPKTDRPLIVPIHKIDIVSEAGK